MVHLVSYTQQLNHVIRVAAEHLQLRVWLTAATISVGVQKEGEGAAGADDEGPDADTTEDFHLNRTVEREPWSRGRGRRGGYRGGRRGGGGRGGGSSTGAGTTAGPGEANKENLVGQEQAGADKAADGAPGESG